MKADLSQPDGIYSPDVSVCIVAYQAGAYLRRCLESLAAQTGLAYEVIIVDNGSTDGTLEMLSELAWPETRLQVVQNAQNEGFTRPSNQAMQRARGRYLLLLNPDTVILPQAIDRLVAFMESHPETGICGPKVLNPDGSLQKPCRRGESRPWAVLSYFLGLSHLFPRRRFFTGYLLTHLDENETAKVDGVAGSCMLIRRDLVEQIGYLDEQFFAYQEDADYCFRARQAGWKVFYLPEAQIIHYGGMGGSRVEPLRSILAWHKSYFLYYRKNLARDYFFLFNWLFYLAMLLKLIFSLVANLLRRQKVISASNLRS